MTGRWVFSFSTQTALMSSVFRVAVSKVRIPRSHSTTLGFPSAMMYSAALSHSSMVALKPLFKRTGRPERPASFKRMKFCMLRAPIWIMSTYFTAASRDS